jgi:hypothetical protein
MSEKLIVSCRMPGRWRAGMQHKQVEAFPLDFFSSTQLAELVRDEVFSFAIGEVATPARLSQLIGEAVEREHVVATVAAKLASGPDADKSGKSAKKA